MLGESSPIQQREADHEVKESTVAADHRAADTPMTSNASDSAGTAKRSPISNRAISNAETAVSASGRSSASAGKRWWLLAAVSALLLTGLTVAGVYLVTKKPSTVDQLVILTVPSGAEIRLDSKDYGHSPVKLERLAIGTYTVTISKEGFEPIVQPLPVAESGSVEYKLKPVLPSEAAGLSGEELLRQFQQRSEEAFARGNYGLPYEGSALHYADLIARTIDPTNSFSSEMRERVRNAAHKTALAAASRGDLAQAQEIYNFLVENYSDDEEARAAATKLEAQLAELGAVKVRDLLRKADEALQAGHLADPARASAYYYSKQALAIDHQNDKARQIRNQVKEKLAAAGEQAYARGDVEAGVKQLEQVTQLFPEDKQARARVRELQTKRVAQPVKAAEPNASRLRGLEKYQDQKFEEAIPDLEDAIVTGAGTADVVFALARSYLRVGKLDQAESYFLKVPQTASDAYHSAIAALGDIALQRGDSAKAVERWKEARQLGGSTLYIVATLDDKIEKIERRQREKAAEPSPLKLQVKHLHGGLGGSCTGVLTIDSTGVRYDGEHVFAAGLSGSRLSLNKKDEIEIRFEGNSQKFRVARADAERCRETLARYQQRYSSANN
jgi:hypothetical protein